MPKIAMEAISLAVIGGVAYDVVPAFFSDQVRAVLLRATEGTQPGAERRQRKLGRLYELRAALAAEEKRWAEWPARSGRFEWMGTMLEEFIAENSVPVDDPHSVPAWH